MQLGKAVETMHACGLARLCLTSIVCWGSRQAAEYTYFALAIAVVLGIIFAVLTNCQFAAGFFTLVLLILTLVYSIIAIIFFLVASVGNDACAPHLFNLPHSLTKHVKALHINESMLCDVSAVACGCLRVEGFYQMWWFMVLAYALGSCIWMHPALPCHATTMDIAIACVNYCTA